MKAANERDGTRTDQGIDKIETRDVRALTECMSVLGHVGRARDADGLYLVVSESGSEYLVDVLGGACECPDHEHREAHCKHLRAAEFASGRREIPEWVDREEINNSLGDHIDAGPVFASAVEPEPDAIAEPTPAAAKPDRTVIADGGVVAESDPQGSTDDDGRPEACSCLPSMDWLGCFACYQAGFATPNPNAEPEVESE